MASFFYAELQPTDLVGILLKNFPFSTEKTINFLLWFIVFNKSLNSSII